MFKSLQEERHAAMILSCYKDQLTANIKIEKAIDNPVIGYTRTGSEIFQKPELTEIEKSYNLEDHKDALYQHKINGTVEGQTYHRKFYNELLKSSVNNELGDQFGNLIIKGKEEVEDLEKSEGSRGGKIIGHTGSGKPIYENPNHPEHKVFTSNDHRDAMNLHDSLAHEHEELSNGAGTKEAHDKHDDIAGMHYDYADTHKDLSEK